MPEEQSVRNPLETEARSLGERLTEVRKERRLSRQALSAMTGISAATIEKYEGGQVPSASKLATLCAHLQLDPREALFFALGDGAGKDAGQRDPKSYDAYVAFVQDLPGITTRKFLQTIRDEIATLQVIEKFGLAVEKREANFQGTGREFMAQVAQSIPDIMNETIEALIPKEALDRPLKKDPEQETPGLSSERHQPKKLEAASTAPSLKRSRKRKPKR